MQEQQPDRSIRPAALRIAEAANYLSVSADTMRRLVRAGDIPHLRIGSGIRIARADLDDYINSVKTRAWSPVDGRGPSPRR